MRRDTDLKITAKFEDAVKALLNTPPPPEPIKGGRAKPKRKRAANAKRPKK